MATFLFFFSLLFFRIRKKGIKGDGEKDDDIFHCWRVIGPEKPKDFWDRNDFGSTLAHTQMRRTLNSSCCLKK